MTGATSSPPPRKRVSIDEEILRGLRAERNPKLEASGTRPEVCRDCGRLSFPGKTITIPVEEYEGLLRRGDASPSPAPNYGPLSRSKIHNDPELSAFVLERAGTMFLREIEAACVATFGRARTPTRSSFHRFLQHARKAASK